MSIDIGGGMIVGLVGYEFTEPKGESLWEWAEDNELDSMSFYYDGGPEDRIYGYSIADVSVNDIDKFAEKVKELGKQFKELTGQDAILYGTQDVC